MLSQKTQAIAACSMPYLRLFLGFIALGVSFYFSMTFLSASTSGAGFIAAIAFVVVTEFTKSIYTGDIIYYATTKQGDKAAFASMVVLVLFALSISASIYFLISSPAKDYTKLDNAMATNGTLDKAIIDKKAQIAACPRNYLTKCINPRTAELQVLEAKQRTSLASMQDFSEIQANREFWRKSAEMFGMTADELEMYFALLRGVLLEVLGLALVGQGMTAFRLGSMRSNSLQVDSEQNTTSNPQIDHSGEISAIQAQLSALLEKQH